MTSRLEAARLHPDRFAVMGRLALDKPESRALVADWRKQPGMLGMRFTFHTDVYNALAHRRYRRLVLAGGRARRDSSRWS